MIDHKLKAPRRHNIISTYGRRLGGEFPAVVVGIGAVVGCFIGYTFYQSKYKDTKDSIGSSIVNAVVIIILEAIFEQVSLKLADWENHRFL